MSILNLNLFCLTTQNIKLFRDICQQTVYRFALAVSMFDQISSNLVQSFLGQINLLAKRFQKYLPSLPLTALEGFPKYFGFWPSRNNFRNKSSFSLAYGRSNLYKSYFPMHVCCSGNSRFYVL